MGNGKKSKMKVCFFGAYEPDYTRNTIIKKGLIKNSVKVVECITSSRPKFWLRYLFLFLKYLKIWGKHDIFFVPAFRHKDVPLAKFLSSLTKKPLVFDPLVSRYETKVFDWGKAGKNSFQAKWNFEIDRLSFRIAHRVLADTMSHADYYEKKFGIDRKKISIVPVGVEEDIFVSLPKKENNFLVQFYGSYLPLHGIEYIVQAAKIIESKEKDIKFELIGSGQVFPQIHSLVMNLKLNNLKLREKVPFGNLPAEIARAEICLGIFGNTEKAKRVVPNKVYQCLSMKKPVITGKTPAILEFFEDEENILLCEVANAESLAEAILKLKNDVNLRERIAENGYQLIKERFTALAIGKIIKDTLKEIIEENERKSI